MRLLLTADWQLTDKQIERRIDNYPESQLEKVKYILAYAHVNNVFAILHAGDMFDSAKSSHNLVQQYISILKSPVNKKSIPFYVIFGQHDMRYRSENIENTPIKVLESAGVVKILKQIRHEHVDKQIDSKRNLFVDIYSVWFGQELPRIMDRDSFNILVIHKMIVDTKLWRTQDDSDFLYARNFLRENIFDLIVSGDNHKPFIVTDRNKTLVNCGSIVRESKDQIDYEPCFWIFDTITREATKIKIPCKKKVFDETLIEQEEHVDKEMKAFVDGLKDDIELQGLDFVKNMQVAIKKQEKSKDLQILADEIFSECEERK